MQTMSAMNAPSGKSILECPSCEKSLLKIGSRVERVDPVPRFIDRHYLKVIVVSALSFPLVVAATGGPDRGMFLGWMGFIILPVLVMYVLRRMYPIYRVTLCPHCGYREQLKLGRSSDA